MATKWCHDGWCVGGWAGDLDTGGTLTIDALRPSLSIRGGGRLSIVAKKPTLVITGGRFSGTFVADAKRATLSITGSTNTLGTFAQDAKRATLVITGNTTTSGTFAADAKQPRLVITQLSTSFSCQVICLENIANTDYSNFEFDSFAEHGDYVLAADGVNGIYSLSGSDDAGTDIDITLETRQDDFDEGSLKAVPDIYVTYEGGPILVRAINESDVRSARELEATTEMKTHRAKVGQGIEELFWGTRVTNEDGGSTDIDRIEMRPYKVRGRI